MRDPIGFLLGFSSILSLAGGCTSAAFDVGAANDEDVGARDDTGIIGDGSITDSNETDSGGRTDGAPIDAPSADGSPGDGGVIEVGPACTPLPPGATDIYVNKGFGGATSNGTIACPFTTITAALAVSGGFSGMRTVHVTGGLVPVVYNEPSSILVNHGIILLGDGPTRTTINASGPCLSGTCAVLVEGNATLDGFAVTSSAGDNIVTAAVLPAPVVRNVNANGSKQNGITVLGSIELGPNVSANNNRLQGVSSGGSGLVHVNSSTIPNSFDNNGQNGIDIAGNATLKLDGGSASANGLNGVHLAWISPTPGTGPTHSITGLLATTNKSSGIAAFSGQNLRVRSSKLLTNGFYGLFYAYAGASVLDVGSVGDPGGITFGGATPALRDTKAGLFLCKSRGPMTQVAEGDVWSGCPQVQLAAASCDTPPSVYVDVAYSPGSPGDPLIVGTCAIGP